MKKVIAVIWFLVSLTTYAQCDIQSAVQCGQHIFTISRNDNGNDVVRIEVSIWDKMMKDTKYVSTNIVVGTVYQVYLQLSDKAKACKKGFGMSCSIFNRDECFKGNDGIINGNYRLASADLYLESSRTICVVFLNNVDWQSLAEDE